MDSKQVEFVEDFGAFFEDLGGGRMVGRILGLLMIADPPEQSAADIATALHASRGGVSQATRVLVQIGMVRRFTIPGTRRDYFQLRSDAFTEATRRRGQEIDRLASMFARAQELTSDRRSHLDETVVFLQFWRQRFDQMFRDWEAEREHLLNDQRNRDA